MLLTSGFAAAVLLLVRETRVPPTGAGPVSITTPNEESPPVTDFGTSVSDRTFGVRTVRFALLDNPLAVAFMLTTVFADTGVVLIVKPIEVEPAGTVTLLTAGFATAALLLESATTISPGAAGHSSVTTPAALLPPVTAVGTSVTDLTLI